MLDVAIEAAKQGGKLALKYFNTKLDVSYKDIHHSPVTKADKEGEILIRKIISKKFPDHGFIGEEFGNTKPKAKYHWTIDPVDGTRDFIRQVPLWCTLISVLENGKPIIAVAYYSTSNEMFYAQKGKGAYLNGKKIKLSNIDKIEDAYLTPSSAHHFQTHNKVKQLVQLSKKSAGARYLSTYGYNLLWKGKSDAYINGRGFVWDFAAPCLITEEAGGKYSDFDGKYKFDSDCAIFSNGKIHNQLLNLLK